jgi:hypothetical protein
MNIMEVYVRYLPLKIDEGSPRKLVRPMHDVGCCRREP